MTEKLYYENQYEKSFTAEIVNITEKNNEFHIVLDKTYFYPEGGGQPSDTGYIESIEVLSVYEENGVIYHVTSKKPIKIHKVKCSISWETRFDFMQQHLGQHILSACLLDKFNATTVGSHLGSTSSTVDVDKLLNIAQIEEVDEDTIAIILRDKYGNVNSKALISIEDLNHVITNDYTWVNYKLNGENCVIANTPNGRVHLDRVIMNPDENKTVHHINLNPLDNRRHNLELTDI
ncbi:MAG: alanine--tRNA ligase-related protein [Clostridium sp.]